jgi:hypothetical protein
LFRELELNSYSKRSLKINKYDQLCNFLIKNNSNLVKLSFTEIEKVISNQLPVSASKYREWWANGGHIQANALVRCRI